MMSRVSVYGIPNCDTVRKARNWLEAKDVDHSFHDLRSDGVPASDLEEWADTVGWEVLLNRRSTTFRNLDEADKKDMNRAKALQLMQAHPTLIKRPVAVKAQRVLVGFTPSIWENDLG
ncbi:arsenate reductase [Alteripontixanthobacter muriae]|uniref:arsenate reductase n=1 Tax=Alteripontixanthobacter muriae TaxID=2705546 RepID=UPI001E4A8533|nr:arsenate reductase [Alteripontixanthobacter muriae]